MTTIKDVARHAGVSITSASYALNGTGTISDATRKRVLASAEALNYHPNAFARNLKNPKTLTIGVFISRFSGAFYEDILEGIHQTILQTDYELIVCPETRLIRRVLMQRQVDGAIVFDSKINSEPLLRLASETFPIVVLDRFLRSEFILPLLIDNMQGTRQAFHHLYNQGCRKIYFIAGAADSFDNRERSEAFLEEADRNGVKVRSFDGNFTEASGFEIGQQIAAEENLPEAVFCANDQMAIGLIKAMQLSGRRVPEDLLVVGFDDIQIASLMRPSLSTIGTSRVSWGAQAAVQMIDFLEHRTPFQLIRLPTWFIQRESSTRM